MFLIGGKYTNRGEFRILANEGWRSYEVRNGTLFVFAPLDCAKRSGRTIDAEEIAHTVDEGAPSLPLEGRYIVLFFNKRISRATVVHDRSTSPLAFYYTQVEDGVFFSTSLKWLLRKSRCSRLVNEGAVAEFLLNGFVSGRKTLLRGVYKLGHYSTLQIDSDGVRRDAVDYPLEMLSESEARAEWKPRLDKAIMDSVDGIPEFAMPLSSGFDSTYILNVLYKNSKANIDAFTARGERGRDELPRVRENLKYYQEVLLTETTTDTSTLQNYPDIIWRLEGAVFEVGVFLQYELMKAVSKSKNRILVCGECADQVMSHRYLQQDRYPMEMADSSLACYTPHEYPYLFGSYVVLKKSGIMANSFDIETRYPYLNERFLAAAWNLRSLNSPGKKIHVENCRNTMPPEVFQRIQKLGGATDAISLFSQSDSRRAFCKFVEGTAFYKQHGRLIKDAWNTAQGKHAVYSSSVVQSARTMKKLFSLMRDGQDVALADEKKVRYYLCVLYLALFKQMFIDDFDDLYDSTQSRFHAPCPKQLDEYANDLLDG